MTRLVTRLVFAALALLLAGCGIAPTRAEGPTSAPTAIPTRHPSPPPLPTIAPTVAPAATSVPTPMPDPTAVSTAAPTAVASDAAVQDGDLGQLQQGVLAAYNCARKTENLPTYTLDPALTREAQRIGAALSADPTLSFPTVAQPYYLHSLIALQPDQSPAGCVLLGYDATKLFPELAQVRTIGIAVFPAVGYAGPSAIVLGQR